MHYQLNEDVLKKVKEELTGFPQNLDMTLYIGDSVDDYDEDQGSCHTTACLAGHIALQNSDGTEGLEFADDAVIHDCAVRTLLGIDQEEIDKLITLNKAVALFHVEHWPPPFQDEYYATLNYSAERAAVVCKVIDYYIKNPDQIITDT